MDHLRHSQWCLACLLAAAVIAPTSGPARAQAPTGPTHPTAEESRKPADHLVPPYFVILGSPADFNALLQKIRLPDVEVRTVQRPATPVEGAVGQAAGNAAPSWVVESVRVRGRVHGDSASLKVEMAILTAADDPTWIPIRLDDQRLIDAREGPRVLDLRMDAARQWQVELAGRGVHRFEVDLRCPVTTRPARAALSLAIPDAPNTALELDFDRRQPDLVVGTNEVYGQLDLPDNRGARLSAHLSPRPRIDVNWAVEADAGGHNPPLLTAQGDIAIDIDLEQMRTRSSWVIRCIRGMTRTLEIRVDEQDVVTELRLDDQQTGAGIEGARGEGRLTIPLSEPLRPGEVKRLVLKTRRSYARGAGHRIAFGGFSVINARQQFGAIGVTQSTNLWVAPAATQALRRILPTFLPQELRERPGTSLAFEFLDQPFSLNLDVETSPPLVRSQSRTLFHIEGDRVRSETTIELQWVRGRLFEVVLGLGPGLEVVSVGPPAVVEAWNPTGTPARRPPGGGDDPRGLTIRLAPTVRDLSKVTLRLDGYQRLPREGPVRLGLFAPDDTTAVASSYAIAGDRGLSVELDEDASRSDRAGEAAFRVQELPPDRSVPSSAGAPGGPAMVVEVVGSPRTLPIRITRHARSIRQETVLSAEVSRQSIDLLQKTTFAVRHGTLAAMEIRVPSAIDDRWELLDREVVDREDLPRDPDGSRRYRLYFDRPVLDRTTLAFRWRLPIRPALDASGARELTLHWITFPEAVAGPARLVLSTTPGTVLRGADDTWTASTTGTLAESAVEDAGLSYTEGPANRGRPFTFRAAALEPVTLPTLVVPRLLIKSGQGYDDAIRCRAWYWVETHGPVFPFKLPDGARMLAARVGGRAVDRGDFEPTPAGYAGYRLRFPAEAASRPALVELEYQLGNATRGAGSHWSAPQLQEGGVVLQTLWEARLPWDRTVLGVPAGWSDENEWYWANILWIRRPWKAGANLTGWILGDGAPAAAVDDLRDSALDDSHHLLFSRSGEPGELGVWIVSRAWLVAACSGATLVLGFIAIFARIRFRTAWVLAAGLALLVATTVQPSLTMQLLQSSMIGAALTMLGLVIQGRLDRRRPPASTAREPNSVTGQPIGDSGLTKGAGVGSDDSTAIRVRTPSTLDYIPSGLPGPVAAEEARSSTIGRS